MCIPIYPCEGFTNEQVNQLLILGAQLSHAMKKVT